MPVYTRVNRAGIRAAFALVILIVLGLAWLIRFAVRAVRNHRAARAAPGRPDGGSQEPMPHSEHHRTTYILGRVMFVVCHACGESAVSLVEHAGEGDLSHRAALRQETQSSYEATG